MRQSIKAFENSKYDYYELQEDLGGIVPKGSIFVHDTDDTVNGSIADGCLKLCWTPEGNTYFNDKISPGLAGGTVIFHSSFKRSNMFKRVAYRDKDFLDKAICLLEECVRVLREEMDKNNF